MNSGYEKQYYEREELWNEKKFQHQEYERFVRTVAFIPPVGSLVDIGCGNGLFLQYLRQERPNIRLCGFDRSEEALKHVHEEKYHGEIIKLPFADRSFEMVTCLEVIEHLTDDIFVAALGEMTRVASRYVLISVPYNEDIDNNLVECEECKKIFNANLHLRSFTKDKMEQLLLGYKYRHTKDLFIGTKTQFMFITAYKKKLTGGIRGKASFCPYCGDIKGKQNNMNRRSGLKKYVQSVWPKKKEAKWILALYERV